MKHFYACMPSGEICMTGMCGDDDLEVQQFAGAAIFEGQPTIGSHYREAQGALVAMPTKPSEHHKFNYTTKQWQPDSDAAWDAVRRQRDRTLSGSDWRVLLAQETGTPATPKWKAYRQALRDITTQADPWNIVWPVAPA